MILLLGNRQVGKTTLCNYIRKLIPDSQQISPEIYHYAMNNQIEHSIQCCQSLEEFQGTPDLCIHLVEPDSTEVVEIPDCIYLRVMNKMDLVPDHNEGTVDFKISALTGQNVYQLMNNVWHMLLS